MNRFLLCFALTLTLVAGSCTRRISNPSAEGPTCPEPVASPESLRDEIIREGRREYQIHRNRHLRAGKNSYIVSSQTVPDRGVLAARLLLRMKRGALLLEGGSEELVNAEFQYPDEASMPDMLSVTSGADRHIEVVGGGREEEWNFRVSNRVPLTALIESEGGYRQLNFDDVPVRELGLQANGGITDVSFLGEHPFLTSSVISQARGSIAMNFSGDYDVLSCVKADTAQGDISGIFRGYFSRLSQVTIESTCGDVELDLTGAWRRTCRVEITCTDGDCVLFIPRGLGTTIYFRTECGRLISPCLKKKWSNNSYINNAFMKTEQFLDISVMTTAGNVYVYEICGSAG